MDARTAVLIFSCMRSQAAFTASCVMSCSTVTVTYAALPSTASASSSAATLRLKRGGR